jgi:phospholipid N-methyltransferase
MNESFAVRRRAQRSDRRQRSPLSGLLRDLEHDFVEHVEFFQSFIREPASVGALSPSSRALARAMIHGMALNTADTVVELGPGTGAFTGLIREAVGRKTTFLSMELDPIHVRNLKRRFPSLLVYNDSAERLDDYLTLHGKSRADYIVSGIPWANLPSEVQGRIMDTIISCLAPTGVFTTFAYFHARRLPKARQFRNQLKSAFHHVTTSPVVWWNLPPAFVYRCSQPRTTVNN